ncbi:MAG: DNA polymerase III subunit gamma/tau [Anaerosomatales bacterium]|nr:DNA polymerase III subunit gamma/tau [Anaerosomatales bacterium]
MAHQSWYRKYRPQRFEQVVGQTHIERTLRNAVAEGTVAHAYLFAGPRGTGKTTTARILAKALDCVQGPTPEPDDTCDDCIAIAEGRHPDVYELDAASRTGVDAVREEIIARVNYAPTRGTWKVYIIDEVHMLSSSAFNALLKTLEEPPARTVFVLCTTHPHKVPETVHSRCQRFDFHRISVEDIAGRLRHIADAEGVEVADAALALIAKHALGGMRDAITTLEQLAAFTSGHIGLEEVEGLLGEVDSDLLFEVADVVLRRDVAGSFAFVARLADRGVDMTEFTKGMVRHFRDLFVIAAIGDDGDVVNVTGEQLAKLGPQARSFGLERLGHVLEVLAGLSSELRWASDQRLAVEVALTRMARPESDLTLAALAERVAALEAGVGVQPVRRVKEPSPEPTEPATSPGPPEGATRDGPSAAKPAAPTPPLEEGPGGGVPAGTLEPAAVKRAWPAVLAEFKKLKPSRSHLFDGTEAEVAGDAIAIEFPAEQRFSMELARDGDTLGLLRRSVTAVLGIEPPLEFRLGRGGAARAGSAPREPVSAAPAEAAAPDGATTTVAGPDAGEGAQDPQELERMVIDELGVEIMADDDAEGAS